MGWSQGAAVSVLTRSCRWTEIINSVHDNTNNVCCKMNKYEGILPESVWQSETPSGYDGFGTSHQTKPLLPSYKAGRRYGAQTEIAT
jgi:hypothetical protein